MFSWKYGLSCSAKKNFNCKEYLTLGLPALEIYNDKSSHRNNSITKWRHNTRQKMCIARKQCVPCHLNSYWLHFVGNSLYKSTNTRKKKVKDVLILQWAILSYCSHKLSYIASFYFSVSVSWRKYKAARLKYEYLHVFRQLICNVGTDTSRDFVVFQGIIGRKIHTLLINARKSVIFDKLIVLQPVKKSPKFYGIINFIAVFTKSPPPPHAPSCNGRIHCTAYKNIYVWFNIFLSTIRSSKNSLSFTFTHQNSEYIFLLLLRVTYPANHILLDFISPGIIGSSLINFPSLLVLQLRPK